MTFNAGLSKKDQVIKYLLQELQSGNYPKGSRFHSENILVKELGICKNTVREAYSSLVGDGMLERIRGKGTFVLGFKNRNNLSTLNKEVHLLAGDPMKNKEDDPFVGAVLTGLHAVLDPFDWHIRVSCMDAVDNIPLLVQTFSEKLNAGNTAILAGFDFSPALTDPLLKQGIKLLTIGRPEDKRISFAHTNYKQCMYNVVKHLVALGHKKIALADRRSSHIPSFEERREGYMQALGESSIIPDARLMVEYHGYDISSGQEVWEKLDASNVKYTAIIIYGDWATLGFMGKVALEGLTIPDDISLISLCNSPLVIGSLQVTRVALCHSELGKAIGQLLIKKPDKPENSLVSPQMLKGNTVKELSI